MTGLPPHIAAYLEDSGFSGTEILILKRLLEGNALTLRELGTKTGKSTGVLDQAIKKLIRKRIVAKQAVNDTTKYSLASVDAISEWVQEDMHSKHAEIDRKQQDFESFMSSLEVEKGRPEMEYFEGDDGIKKAYKKLLTLGDELLRCTPILFKEEDDPLRIFRIEYFRARRHKKIFERVITHDSPLGRRFKSRDDFEYRQTVLVPNDRCPFSFEKIIAGDTLACFDHKEKKVSFIHYPQLVEAEKAIFEAMWKHEEVSDSTPSEPVSHEKTAISMKTKTLSGLRGALLSPKTFNFLMICGLLTISITYGLYRQNLYLNTQRIRERVKAIAANSAPEFTEDNLNILNGLEDVNRVEYQKVVHKLVAIRERNPDVMYVYIMRPTDDKHFFEFVADAESANIHSKIDLNEDGLVNDMIAPGHLWLDDDPDYSALHRGWTQPDADSKPTSDPWGVWISGHAPIVDNNGNTMGIIGIDMDAGYIQELTNKSFSWILYFTILFVGFVIIRLAALNRRIL